MINFGGTELNFWANIGFGYDLGFGTVLVLGEILGQFFVLGNILGQFLVVKAHLLSCDIWTRTGLSGGAEFGAV